MGGVVVRLVFCDNNTTPGYTTPLYSALDCGNIVYNMSILQRNMGGGGVLVVFCDSNTTPGYTTLLYSALDCGNIV